MLIARAHVHMDFRRVKGCQYKYSGHVVNFMQNTAKIINRLPSLPTELQVVILKPSSSTVNDSAVHREFAKTFRVQRKNVQMWLDFLVIHHPDYQDVVTDQERLSQLPGDDTCCCYYSFSSTFLFHAHHSHKPHSLSHCLSPSRSLSHCLSLSRSLSFSQWLASLRSGASPSSPSSPTLTRWPHWP